MNIHREGRLFLLILLVALAAANWVTDPYLPEWLAGIMVVGSVVLYLFFMQFFRNPKRELTRKDNAVVSPADGTIVVMEKVFEDEYLMREVMQISIFMSPLNVHLNRVPIDGTVEYYKYHPGKYLVAFHPKSSKLNERNTTVIRTIAGQQLLLRQIAGAVARRIRFYLQPGDQVTQGQELGFIKFGSRMDVFLPLDAEIMISMDQKVKGGQTILAILK